MLEKDSELPLQLPHPNVLGIHGAQGARWLPILHRGKQAEEYL